MIDGIEVEIGEKLTGEVADRQATGALQRGEQGVAGEGINGGSPGGAVRKNRAQQPEGAGAGDPLLQLGQQQQVIDGGKVEADIGLEHPAVLAAGPGKAAQGAVGAVALAVGIAGGAEAPLQGQSDHGDQGVVHHPIAEGCRTHQAGLGLTDGELAIGARGIGEALQLVLQPEQLGFKVGREGQHLRPVALALGSLAKAARRVEKLVIWR
jgi:hypothetical protein